MSQNLFQLLRLYFTFVISTFRTPSYLISITIFEDQVIFSLIVFSKEYCDCEEVIFQYLFIFLQIDYIVKDIYSLLRMVKM